MSNLESTQGRERNLILRGLPPDEYARLRPHLEAYKVDALQILVDAGEPVQHVYFPENAIVSVARRTGDGSLVEAGTVGREGMAGLAVILGESWSPAVLQGQVPGACKRVAVPALRRLLPELSGLDSLLRRYALTFLDQLGQAAACNAVHSVEQRCARWLLMTHDRVGGDEFELTHSVLAQMLGVRRASVSEVAASFHAAGIIDYQHGRVVIRQRAGLEAAACACYGIVRSNLQRLLGPDAAGR
ncbi:MAG: Crp/Fnr family transcriptional regulator [Gemmatimonadota bacterium]|nr:Crp/Fnr family transcriptional regulator [Gemmatimonadota bacterium]